jgi:phosphoadenosine phosphosulfate reductase
MDKTLLQKIENASALIKRFCKEYPNHLFAFSGGKDSTVLVHLAFAALDEEVRKSIRVDAVLSDTEFEETHEFIKEFSDTYGINITEHYYHNDPTKPEEASKENKTGKFREVLADVDCWFSGIRRDEGATRKEIEDFEEDKGLIKVNPIADFTEKDIWRYLAVYRVPVNKAYKDGYRSLSCRLSSQPEERGDEGERDGRWKGTLCKGGECGIHSQSMRV